MNHDVQVEPSSFDEIRELGELVLENRNFAIGDSVSLREFDPTGRGRYTGRMVMRRVTNVTNTNARGRVVLSIGPMKHANEEPV